MLDQCFPNIKEVNRWISIPNKNVSLNCLKSDSQFKVYNNSLYEFFLTPQTECG